MKCQILFSGKNKKNISKCRLLKILPRVLSVKDLQIYHKEGLEYGRGLSFSYKALLPEGNHIFLEHIVGT